MELSGKFLSLVDKKVYARQDSALKAESSWIVSLSSDLCDKKSLAAQQLHQVLQMFYDKTKIYKASFAHNIPTFRSKKDINIVKVQRFDNGIAVWKDRDIFCWDMCVDTELQEVRSLNIGVSVGNVGRFLILSSPKPLCLKKEVDRFLSDYGVGPMKDAKSRDVGINGNGFNLEGFRDEYGKFRLLSRVSLETEKTNFVYVCEWFRDNLS